MEPKIHLSYRFTWLNAIFTSCMTGGFLAYACVELPPIGAYCDLNYGSYGAIFYSGCALVPLSLLSLLLIQCLGKCSCLCNETLQENCLPMKPSDIRHWEFGETFDEIVKIVCVNTNIFGKQCS